MVQPDPPGAQEDGWGHVRVLAPASLVIEVLDHHHDIRLDLLINKMYMEESLVDLGRKGP